MIIFNEYNKVNLDFEVKIKYRFDKICKENFENNEKY